MLVIIVDISLPPQTHQLWIQWQFSVGIHTSCTWGFRRYIDIEKFHLSHLSGNISLDYIWFKVTSGLKGTLSPQYIFKYILKLYNWSDDLFDKDHKCWTTFYTLGQLTGILKTLYSSKCPLMRPKSAIILFRSWTEPGILSLPIQFCYTDKDG